ncbi:MAG: cobyrinic acid a,c-diamide synthase [Pseudomonadota bacterium]
MKGLLISAAHKSSGKTTITVGLCAALAARGLHVQSYKKGPDYIDPMWLAQASGNPCFNLDPYLQSASVIAHEFTRHSHDADIHIVEGNKGLYDGLALDGSNSNAALAKMLNLPVVLVLDARGMTRGIAPLILGYQAFDPAVKIAGVILNQLGGSRHESKLRAVIEHYTDVTVLGAVAHDPQLAVVERHLGLMPHHEMGDADARIRAIGNCIADQVDLEKILLVSASANAYVSSVSASYSPLVSSKLSKNIRIGVARDKAFGFYYPDDCLALEAAGAALIPFDTLNDTEPPAVDALFIGGGFPEMFMPELAANISMRESIRSLIEGGMPAYAECGGLMYMARSIAWNGQSYPMVGALPMDIAMHAKPVGRGYVALRPRAEALWSADTDNETQTVRGHEFHYSSIENADSSLRYAYDVVRGYGCNGQCDGIIHRHLLANYAHLRSATGSHWAQRFVEFIQFTLRR